MPVLHKYAKPMKETDERSGVLYLRFNKVSGSSDRVCSIMDVLPAVDPDPTAQTSAPVFPSHSLLKRAPTCLLSGSEARSLLCPFFQVKPYLVLIISSGTWGWLFFRPLFIRSGFGVCLWCFVWRPSRFLFVSRVLRVVWQICVFLCINVGRWSKRNSFSPESIYTLKTKTY